MMNQANKKDSKKNLPTQFIPLGFVLKYDPPVIGLLYKPADAKQTDKKKMYTIHLNQLIFLAEPEDILEALFQEHPHFLDPNIVKPDQVYKLVLRLVAYRDHQLQNMGAFMTDGMGEEYYQEGEEEEEDGEYTPEEMMMHFHDQKMNMKQQMMMQQVGGKGKGKSDNDLNRSF